MCFRVPITRLLINRLLLGKTLLNQNTLLTTEDLIRFLQLCSDQAISRGSELHIRNMRLKLGKN